MATKNSWNALVFLLVLIGAVEVMAHSPREIEIEKILKKLNKPAIKTIESPDGDIVDCVDIYKQPAFDHPLLKNHTIEMRPNFPAGKVERGNYSKVFPEQIWRRKGSCPKGTIPIRRVLRSDIVRSEYLERFGAVYPNPIGSRPCRLETAGGTMSSTNPTYYHGAGGVISIWEPRVETDEYTDSMIHIRHGDDNYISVGWMLHPDISPIAPRLTVAYKNRERGCLNLHCSGFVQVNDQIELGGRLTPSMIGHDTLDLQVKIQKNIASLRWDVFIDGVMLGYYPFSMVGFAQANSLQWVGRVCNRMVSGEHTTTKMGSGLFPSAGYGKSADFHGIYYFDQNNHIGNRLSSGLQIVADYPHCYNAMNAPRRWGFRGITFLYGGPGGRGCDQT